ncbi:nematocin receptor 2-like [Haliotis rufescens]|uniref:nematocin receptor 2-like n=1 Tax=Haliotis rufescens TaxID=6454 RepID=UPI00201EF764|nr:nematocin receptor 2-like [Haliotis rufescens]
MAACNISQPNDSVSKEDLLWEENENMAKTLIPAMAFVGFIMVTGFFGNILVCYIFTRKIPLSVNTFLLVFLAALDLVNCTLAMPFEIMDMRYFYVFESDVTCKIFRFIVAFPNIDSAFVLLIITINRYTMLCRPMSIQMTMKEAKRYVAIATTVAIFLSLPAVCIYGKQRVETSIDGLCGQDCTTSDNMKGSIFPFVYQIFGGSVMLLISVAICYMYIHVWREVRKHKKNICNNTQFVLHENSKRGNISSTNSDFQDEEVPDVGNTKHKSIRGKRITVIACTVTFAFILSYLPFAVIMAVRSFLPLTFHPNGVWYVTYNILIRSYFISSMTNSFVYGFVSLTFRQECWKLIFAKCPGK